MKRRSWTPPPRPIATVDTDERMPMVDRGASVDVQNAQIDALRAWCVAKGIPYFGPEGAMEAECYTCGRRAPWSGSVEALRRALCSECGGRGASLRMDRA